MMSIEIQPLEGFETLSEEYITSFEMTLPYTLPLEYKTFLQRYNGGNLESCYIFHIKGPAKVSVLFYFIGFKDDFSEDTIELKDMRYQLRNLEGRIPKFLLPIALDAGGDPICLSLIDSCIYFWDHEFEPDEEEQPSLQNVFWVANNLTGFLDNLRPCPPEFR